MAIPVILQKNKSEKICLTKDTETILSIDAVLKDETSIIDPVFIIETDLSTISEVNYLTVSAFRRSYFVLDMVSITANLVQLNCHVDVLASFASEIKANKGIVYRQEENWNLYLNDGVIEAYQNPIVVTQAFPKGFTKHSFVLMCAGSRNIGGISIGGGNTETLNTDGEGGSSNSNGKTTSGLVGYAKAQLGKPYWYGTFGNVASAALLLAKREQYGEEFYPNPGSPDFTTQYGQRVHDCVGLIKGYRWSNTFDGDPMINYTVASDVNVRGMYAESICMRGDIDRTDPTATYPIGCLVFYSNMQHVGVYIGNGHVIEARNHASGVVETTLATRTSFTKWAVPDWMTITTGYG